MDLSVFIQEPKHLVRNELNTNWLTTETLLVNGHIIYVTQADDNSDALVQVMGDHSQRVYNCPSYENARDWGINTAKMW